MRSPIAERVKKRRDVLRAAGLRPIQMWVPDTRSAGFAAECRRQSAIVAAADRGDTEMAGFLDAALADLFTESDE